MSLIKTASELENWFMQNGREEKSLGLVPTMGFLHEGHLSLIRRAKAENDLVAVSVFVNPTQFGPTEDFATYPRDINRDYALAMEVGADVIFNPEVEEIYQPGFSTFVEVTGDITHKLCGVSRPSHFKGVTTVVNILFQIVKPNRAYFGQKDAQQSIVIKKMVSDLHMPVKIVVCPIIREADGLALSSRNVYLSQEERKQALSLNKGLKKAQEAFLSGKKGSNSVNNLIDLITDEIAKSPLANIDYVEILDGDTLESIEKIEDTKTALAAVAVKFGKTRLIDNVILTRK